jgi:prepilin-type N-terminal cleavage/methylation domain-containing protein
MRRETGFTLVEILVTLAIVGILLSGIYSMLIRQQQSYQTQDQVVEVQQNLRTIAILMRYDLRMMGHGLPEGTPVIVTVSNNRFEADGTDAIVFNGNLGAASVVLPAVGQTRYLLQTGQVITFPVASLEGFPTTTPYPIDLLDLGTGAVVASADLIGLSDANGTVTLLPQQSGTLLAGSYIGLPFQTVTYRVNTAGSVPALERDSGSGPEVVAEGVEDFQIAYGFDGINGQSQDGQITEIGASGDDDEWVYNIQGDSWPLDSSGLRMVRVSILLRTLQSDPHFRGNRVGVLEDHLSGSTENRYRRRLIQFTETVRNLSLGGGT